MAKVYKIEGLDDCIKCMDQAPENVMKMTKAAMKEAGRQTARLIRSATPARWKRLVGSKVTKGQLTGDTYALVGYFNKGKKKGSNAGIPDWFKAYWKNYGTLTKRDQSHRFEYGVKAHSNGRRNNVGQPAENFFEAAIGGWDSKFFDEFQKSMVKQENKLYDR